jgi:hypothetical protein
MESQSSNLVVALATGIRASSYLELGLDHCRTIKSVINSLPECKCTGVDLRVSIKDGSFDYYEGTTDSFFEQNTNTFDLIFIDADHSHVAVEKDLHNALKVLNKHGVIIMHDMDPASDDLFDHTRCGDCYKLNNFFPSLDVNFVTLPVGAEGITIITKKDNLRCAHKL